MRGFRTIDFVANALISLIARGARFLNVTPWSYVFNQPSITWYLCLLDSTYSLVEMDCVLARNDISDGGSGGLAGGLLGLRRHF